MDQERFDRLTRTMATGQSRRGLLKGLTGTAIGGLLASVGLAEASAKGNSANAKRCQNGKWATLAPSEHPNTAFASQDACVSYGARGGMIVDAEQEVEFTGVRGNCVCSDGSTARTMCASIGNDMNDCLAACAGPFIVFIPSDGSDPNCNP